ncbi:MAG: hypothetical protein K9M07_03570 [Simkaniaceae bacterium]|nr:hypothetical protein [Simkaniaceae bacterium]MCF7852304.1 hypothetical protein [Simkaniaceae bacterium]
MKLKKILIIVIAQCLFIQASVSAKLIKFTYEYELAGEKKDLTQLIAITDLFCNAVIFQCYEKIGKKIAFLDVNVHGFPLKDLSLNKQPLVSKFEVKIEEAHISHHAPVFFDTFFNLNTKLLSPNDFVRSKSITRHFYEGQFDKSQKTDDASSVIVALDDINYRHFCEYISSNPVVQKMRICVEQKQETAATNPEARFRKRRPFKKIANLSSELENRGFQFASPITDFKKETYSAVDSQFVLVKNSFQLSLAEDKKRDISHIITQMGTKSDSKLLWHVSDLKKRGDNIKHVPTLQFLAYIFSNSNLRDSMKKIKGSYFKWTLNMQKEISSGLQKQFERGELQDQLEGFAEFIGVNYDELKKASDNQDWNDFLNALMR